MIKLRLFDKRYGRYLNPYSVGNMILDAINSKDYIVEQFTGLQDKNDKDIYVGDIVRRKDNLTGTLTNMQVVFFYDRFELKKDATSRQLVSTMVEVIGNINENKELLK